ncbi:MAG: class I SAM-dependent methyltransferase [Candidatus Micrarchaeota archaeon]|nr:class I SAM-dependent methyltransferase [Candidatus Micrarchaeota archaeon]
MIAQVRLVRRKGHFVGTVDARHFVGNRETTSQEDYKLHLPREIYSRTAMERFSLLDKDYFAKKATEDKFPLEGNVKLAKAIVKNISKAPGRELVVLDIGAAGGALTTLCLLKELFGAGMVKVKSMLLDISMDALKATKGWDFVLPMDLLRKKYGWTDAFVNFAKGIISNAEIIQVDILSLDRQLEKADICISGFTHHHLNIYDKQAAVKAMESLTKSNCIVGVVDESLSPKDYLRWAAAHEHETNSRGQTVPIALESFIRLERHIGFLESSIVLAKGKEREYYYFVARKQ